MAAERSPPAEKCERLWCGSWRWLWAGIALAVTAAAPYVAAADLVFRVPEVLVRHAAAERAVGSARGEDAPEASPPHFEEYFVEHSISTVEARRVATSLDLARVAAPEGCGVCSRRELAYCEARLLADHCCCERRYLREPLPWLPHTCYVGPGVCRPLAGDCARYARLRDCCCLHRLALHWRNILVTGRGSRSPALALVLLPAALAALAALARAAR